MIALAKKGDGKFPTTGNLINDAKGFPGDIQPWPLLDMNAQVAQVAIRNKLFTDAIKPGSQESLLKAMTVITNGRADHLRRQQAEKSLTTKEVVVGILFICPGSDIH